MNIVVLWQDGFPFADTHALTQTSLRSAFSDKDTVRFVPVAELAAGLESTPDLFVNPYGSAFPKSAWTAFTGFLRRGGNWVNLGGAPVTRPVRKADDRPQTTDHGPGRSSVVGGRSSSSVFPPR